MRESAGETERVVSGHVETFGIDVETGEVILSVRLDPDHATGDLGESEVVLDGPLFLPSDVEGAIFDLLGALDLGGGPRE